MADPISMTVLGALTDSVFSYALEQSGLSGKIRSWLGREPAHLAFQSAFLKAFRRFRDEHGQWAESFADETFLRREDVAWELSRFLTRRDSPDPDELARAWAEQLPHVGEEHRPEAARALAEFLRYLEEELGNQEALRPLFDSRALERIAANTGAYLDLMRETLGDLEQALSDSGIHIEGSVWGSVLVTGHHNAVYQTVLSRYPDLKDYVYDFTSTIEELTRWFVGREFLLAETDAFVDAHESGIFRLVADPGLGKSAMAATWARYYDAPVFFFGPKGSPSPRRCLEHLCAELIARYRLSFDHLPDRAGDDANFLNTLLQEAVAEHGAPVVLVIDALDEAEGSGTGYWVPLPDPLPKGAYVLVTHRPGDYPLPGAPRTFELRWDDSRQQADIATFLSIQARRSKIRRALEAARPPIAPETFVHALAQASEGNFMYLHYVLEDISERQPGFDPLRLDELPLGLRGYYGLFWQRMEQAKREEGWEAWRDLYKAVLGLLAVAPEPVPTAWLSEHTGRDEEEVRERVLTPWRRFLRREMRDSRPYWSIIHRSFADFLEEKIGLSTYHRRVAEYYLHHPERWTAHSAYALRNLTYHLVEAGMFTELTELVESRAWYETHKGKDEILLSYAQSLEPALQGADRRVLEEGDISALPHVVAWSLLYATVRTRATYVPVEALEAMVLLGRTDEAFRYAALTASPERRSWAFWRIADRLVEREEKNRARRALGEALAAAERIQDEWDRANTLAVVAEALAQVGEIDRALAAAERIQCEQPRADALARVAEAVAQVGNRERLGQALAAAERIRNEWHRASALAAVASALAQAGEGERAREALDQALAAAERIRNEWHRASALEAVAKALAQVGEEQARRALDEALAAAERIQDEGHRAYGLAVVAEAVAQAGEKERAREALDKAFATAEKVQNEWSRAYALKAVVEAMAQVGEREELGQALAAAERIQDQRYRADALAAVAKALAQVGDRVRLGEALAAAEKIQDKRYRADALAGVAEALAQVGEVDKALAAAERIRDERHRADALAGVAEALAQVGEEQARRALDEALAAAERIQYEWHRAYALRAVVASLAQVGDRERLGQALVAAERIRNEKDRAYALAAVAASLAQVGDRERLVQALAAAERIRNEKDRVDALAQMALGLAQVEETVQARRALGEALATTERIQDEKTHADALEAMAEALAQVEETEQARRALGEALAAAKRIQDEWARAYALKAMAEALAQAEETEQARRALGEALTAAKEIQDEWERAYTLGEVAEALAQVEDKEGLGKALVVAERIQDEQYRTYALGAVAEALARVGEVGKALAAAEEIQDEMYRADTLRAVATMAYVRNRDGFGDAIATAERIRDEGRRASALAVVASALAQVGVRDDLREALAAAERIQDETSRAYALGAVASALAQVGARDDLREALAAAERIRDEKSCAYALGTVATAVAQVEDKKGLEEALAAAERIRNEKDRADALSAVVRALALVRDGKGLEQALAVADKIQYEGFRAETLAAVAEALDQVGEEEQAREALGQALAAAERIQYEEFRTDALAAAAMALASVGGVGWTLAAAERIRNGSARTLAAVAKALAQVTDARHIKAAQLVAKSFQEARTRKRGEVWQHIRWFAPVLAKLGVISETWKEIQVVEKVVGRAG